MCVCVCVLAVSESTRRVDDAVQCDGHDHFDIDVVDEVISLNVDDVFNHIFSDSPLFTEFIRRRRTSGLSADYWRMAM